MIELTTQWYCRPYKFVHFNYKIKEAEKDIVISVSASNVNMFDEQPKKLANLTKLPDSQAIFHKLFNQFHGFTGYLT